MSLLSRVKSWWSAPGPGWRGPVAYDAGRVSRKDPDFTPMMIGPNGLNDRYLDMAWRRVRHLVDNHPLMRGARNCFVNNVVGDSGIRAVPATKWAELNKVIQERWDRFCQAVDVGREMTWTQMQRQMANEMFVGDCLLSCPVASAWRGRPGGIAVELFGPEQLDLTLNTFIAKPGSAENRVRNGVEFDGQGRRVAYHVWREHPNDSYAAEVSPRRLSAEDAHLAMFDARPRQARGTPVCLAAVSTARMQDNYHESYMLLAMAAASVGIYFEGLNLSQLGTQTQWPQWADGKKMTEMRTGNIGAGPLGSKPHVLGSNIPGPSFEPVHRKLAMDLCAPIGTPYSEVTGDYGDATFSSERGRQLAARKVFRPAMKAVAQGSNAVVYTAWLRHEITFNDLPLTGEQRKAWELEPWRILARRDDFPGFEWVNPQQEAQAAEISLAIGSSSLVEIAAQRGRDIRDVIDEQLEIEVYEKERRKELGLEPRQPAPVRPAGEDPDKKPAKKPADKGAELNGRLNGHLNGHVNGVASDA